MSATQEAPLRVLLVDDSPTMRKLMRFILARVPRLEIFEANDGMDGLRKLTESHYDLAIVDVNMPVLDGITLIKMIREEASLKDMKIIVVTSEGQSGVRIKAMHVGANDYITKPVQGAEVKERVQKMLRLS